MCSSHTSGASPRIPPEENGTLPKVRALPFCESVNQPLGADNISHFQDALVQYMRLVSSLWLPLAFTFSHQVKAGHYAHNIIEYPGPQSDGIIGVDMCWPKLCLFLGDRWWRAATIYTSLVMIVAAILNHVISCVVNQKNQHGRLF